MQGQYMSTEFLLAKAIGIRNIDRMVLQDVVRRLEMQAGGASRANANGPAATYSVLSGHASPRGRFRWRLRQ